MQNNVKGLELQFEQKVLRQMISKAMYHMCIHAQMRTQVVKLLYN